MQNRSSTTIFSALSSASSALANARCSLVRLISLGSAFHSSYSALSCILSESSALVNARYFLPVGFITLGSTYHSFYDGNPRFSTICSEVLGVGTGFLAHNYISGAAAQWMVDSGFISPNDKTNAQLTVSAATSLCVTFISRASLRGLFGRSDFITRKSDNENEKRNISSHKPT